MRIDLNNCNWQFKMVDEDKIYKAKVPGCNYLDLMQEGIIADPFVGTNEKDVYWVSEKDWLYKTIFSVSKSDMSHDVVMLSCDMLDTIATLSLNGKQIGTANNCHIKHSFDIKDYLVEGDNLLEILFNSPVKYVNQKQSIEKAPANSNGLNGIVHIRKPQCHFGWDWGPVLTPSGISGDIYIEAYDIAKISDFKITQKHFDQKVNLTIEIVADNFAQQEIQAQVNVVSPSGEIVSKSIEVIDSGSIEFEINNPILWSTRELSGKQTQDLYTIVLQLKKQDKILDNATKKVGLRTIILKQNKDNYGQNFCFVLNGKEIFAKGANWIPADSFINRVTRPDLEFYIKSAADCNFNMLRVWGGGFYESEDFYDLCDKYGILVWQDFAFACQPYPFFDHDFIQNVKKEIEYNVVRLRHRASLCLWCGNNEIELMSIAWITRKKYVEWTEKYFYDILPKIVAQFDNTTAYIAGTPIGTSHNKGVNDDNIGDTHLWAVWHGLQDMKYYRKRMTRFCSEFGFESLPDIKCIDKFATPDDYSLTGKVFSSHQKCNSGNMKMAYYIASRFRLPKNFCDYIYLSQICQQECIRDATEHWRRNKGRCNGSLFWQYNDCWPVCSWAGIDYHKNYKALQYSAKKFFAPSTISIQDDKKVITIYTLNDSLNTLHGNLKVELIDFCGKQLYSEDIEVNMQPNTSQSVYSIQMKKLRKLANVKKCVLVATLNCGKVSCQKTLLFDNEKNLKLPNSNINVDVKIDDNRVYYTLKSDKFVRLVRVSSKIFDSPFDDNYFDLLPNQELIISQLADKQATVDQAKQAFDCFSYVDVVPKSSKLGDFFVKAKVFLQPINFFSWIYYQGLAGGSKSKSNKTGDNNE